METLDPHGWMLSLISITVVFSALLILYVVYTLIGKLSTRSMANKSLPAEDKDIDSSAAEAAAIAMALNLYLAEYAHDRESGIITIEPHESNWNSKDYRKRV